METVEENRREHIAEHRGTWSDDCPDCLGDGHIFILDIVERPWTYKCDRCNGKKKLLTKIFYGEDT